MKILIVHEVNYLSKIIYEFQILPEILSILGHEITVVDYNDSWKSEAGERLLALNTTVHRDVHRAYPKAKITVRRPGMIRLPLISRISGAAAATLEIVRVLKKEKPDVLLLYGLPTIGLQAMMAARRFKVPIVFRGIDVSHQLVPNRLLVPFTKLLERMVFNGVDLNIALTPHLKKYISAYGVPDERIRLLPSGVDADLFSPGPRDHALLERWGIDPGDPVILFMGTIYRFSGLDRVIMDFPTVLKTHPKAKLLILGAGEDEKRLRHLAQEKQLASHVVFTGMQPYSDLTAYIRSSDVCINPFELNGITKDILPTKLFQYMTCEKPVLATELPGTLTFLPGEEQGLVYTTLGSFNTSLAKLLSEPERCKELGLRAKRAAKAYEWRQIAETLAGWLAEVA